MSSSDDKEKYRDEETALKVDDSVEVELSEIEEDEETSWAFSQWFRTQESEENSLDALTSMSFNSDGSLLATGDMGGRIVVLKSEVTKAKGLEYRFHVEFQSHDQEFDYVRSQGIEEQINRIEFLPSCNYADFLLSTNDREVKLWKIYEDDVDGIIGWNLGEPPRPLVKADAPAHPNLNRRVQISDVRLPIVEKQNSEDEPFVVSKLRRTFSRTVHDYNINSLASICDGETFLSGDNLRINQWSLNLADQSYNLVDIRPADIKDLKEWINAIDTHPEHSSIFAYGTNLGNVNLCDTRVKARCNGTATVFKESSKGGSEGGGDAMSFFDELTRSVADVQFTHGGGKFVTRDFMSLKYWDIRKENAPFESVWIHEYLRPSEAMWHVYDNDLIHDRFQFGIAGNGNLVTGSYSNYFHIYDIQSKTDTFIQASKADPIGIFPITTTERRRGPSLFFQGVKKKKKGVFSRLMSFTSKKKQVVKTPDSNDPYGNFDYSMLDFSQKILDCAWHPEEDVVAIAGSNNLFVYKNDVKPGRKLTL